MTSDEFAVWIEPHQDMIARIVTRLARPSDRDDAYQRTIVAAWKYRDSFDERYGSLTGWLAAIATNEARRTWSRRAELPLPPDVQSMHIDVTQVERDVDLERCIRRLKRQQQIVVHLYYFADLSVADCATAMGLSEAAVKDLLFRARRKLAVLWGDR